MLIGSWLLKAIVTTVIAQASLVLPIQLETVSGDKVSGNWAGTTESAIRLEMDGQIQEILFDRLVLLTPQEDPETGIPPTVQVSLSGGTQVLVQDLMLKDNELTIEPRRQDPFRVPIDLVAAIRFRQGETETDPQWLGLLDQEHRSDVMVIRRNGQQLDPIEGVAEACDLRTLTFDLEGEKIEAPTERLEGVLFRTAGAAVAQATTVRVTDVYGSSFAVAELAPSTDPDQIDLRLPGDIRHSIPINQLSSIRWASGRVLLSGQDSADVGVSPLLKSKLSDDLIRAWFAPKGQGEDLIAGAGGFIEYRVDPGFKTLAGSVARDPDAREGGAVTVRILVDDNVEWEQSLTGQSSLGFRVSVTDARRIRLEVNAGDDGDVGDQVRFIQPRLLK